jgi:hypothetical protein
LLLQIKKLFKRTPKNEKKVYTRAEFNKELYSLKVANENAMQILSQIKPTKVITDDPELKKLAEELINSTEFKLKIQKIVDQKVMNYLKYGVKQKC